MKKYFYIALTAFVGIGAISLTSCSDDGPETGGEVTITELHMTADKTTVEANNQDVATFTVTNQDGVDVTSHAKLRFMKPADNTFLREPKATMYSNEEFTYIARYSGAKSVSSNEVKIKGVNRKNYEKYYRHVAVYQLTGTWCVNCPTLTKALETVASAMPDRMVRMAFHGGKADEPFLVPATDQLATQFNLSGYPSGVVDMRESFGNASVNAVTTAIRNSMANYPATCGVKIATSLNGKMVTINPEVTVEKDGVYSMGYAILVDKLQAAQEGATTDYLHNNTVRGISNIYGSFNAGNDGTLKAGDKWTPVPATAYTAELPTNMPVADTRVVVFVLKKETDNKWYINNLATCAVDNGSVDYKLND